MRAGIVLVVFAALLGCSSARDGGYDYASSKGAALYAQMCSVCHGEIGEGGLGPTLLDTKRSHGELEAVIDARMPANNPGQCAGECAVEVAAFIKDGLTSGALACDRAQPRGPRRLRLLTRREYAATVAAVLGDDAPAMACSRPTQCAFRDRCEAGTCEANPCDTQTFVFDSHGQSHASIHVAGDFNGWPQTIAGGGYALTYSATTGQWSGTFSIAPGVHQYKLVLDERDWIVDPRAPATASDGFGGSNGAFTLACSGGAIPAENRPAGFPFDTDADSAVVTSTHVDAYLAAAEQLADRVAANPAQLHACSWSGTPDGCKRELLGKLGRRLYRRPLAAAELDGVAQLPLATAIHALLVSPHFLYRSELGEPDGEHWRLTDFEVATALAYTFTGRGPADALLDAAEHGELATSEGVEIWARRLIADPRARGQVAELVLQWVGGQTVVDVDKRADLFPDFDGARRSLVAETRDFATHVAFESTGTFDELLTADYTMLDATAARFYGAPGTGEVAYDGTRAGILGHASVLATTAHSDQTSPIRRGLLIRRNVLCQNLPPPPPFAGNVPEVDPSATTRERFAQHTDNEVCAGCHRFIDSVGFGFEKLDPVGRWRELENGKPIDASGDMTDVDRLGSGTSAPYSTLPELARILAGSRAAPSCFTRQTLRFSRGLRETLAERCDRLWLEDKFAASGHDLRELLVQSVLSPGFRERR
jgi:hypothetical protein